MYVTTSSSSPASAKARSMPRSKRGRDDQLVGNSALAQQRRHPGEQAVDRRSRLPIGPAERVELVVQRPEALHRRHVLGHPAERPAASPGTSKVAASRRASSSARSSPSTGTTRPPRIALRISFSTSPPASACAGALRARLLAQDPGVQLLELRAGLDPELVDERRPCVAERLSASACRPLR